MILGSVLLRDIYASFKNIGATTKYISCRKNMKVDFFTFLLQNGLSAIYIHFKFSTNIKRGYLNL